MFNDKSPKYFWHSPTLTDAYAQAAKKQNNGDKGYGIVVDANNVLHQFTMVTQNPVDDKQHAGQYPDLYHAARESKAGECKVLVTPTGKINEGLASQMGIKPQMDEIKKKTKNFREPKI